MPILKRDFSKLPPSMPRARPKVEIVIGPEDNEILRLFEPLPQIGDVLSKDALIGIVAKNSKMHGCWQRKTFMALPAYRRAQDDEGPSQTHVRIIGHVLFCLMTDTHPVGQPSIRLESNDPQHRVEKAHELVKRIKW